MKRRLRFRVNERLVDAEVLEETLTLDYLRRELGLTGSKEGCREGDCGACLVLLGRSGLDGPSWRAVTSCLLALGDLDGCHVVTIEGIAAAGLTPVMEAFLDEGASQCGFCSPGFIVALTTFLVEGRVDPVRALVSIEGNLCRCTGYGSIRRAAERLARDFAGLPAGLGDRLRALAERRVLPATLVDLMAVLPEPAGLPSAAPGALTLGGGTDWFVRNPDPEPAAEVAFIHRQPGLDLIERKGDFLEIGAAVTVRDFFENPLVAAHASGIGALEERVASLPIRNRATLAGNIVNASPVADMTVLLLALEARVRLRSARAVRELYLAEFFLGYKKTALAEGEFLEALLLPAADGPVLLSFEKVSKRESLDIATASTALGLRAEGGRIIRASLSAGGMAAVPFLARRASEFLVGREPDADTAREAARAALAECTPISDIRGSAGYRARLFERLVLAHFVRLFPERNLQKEFWP
ncbi:MAG TPA: FAD binding domain-containing protein [Magnetospirillaceae bacterium]|nr:FAD binding domain-containing protein [Magnetospirillaceae bacterium]